MALRVVVIAVLLVTGALAATPASAGTIDVYGCRLADGAPAPADGWTPFAAAMEAPTVYNGCGRTRGAFGTTVNAMLPSGAASGWRFDAPADTTITAVQLQHWAGAYTDGSNGTMYYDTAFDAWPPPAAGDPDGEACRPAGAASSCDVGDDAVMIPEPRPTYQRAGLRHTRLFLGLRCVSTWSCSGTNLPFFAGPGIDVVHSRITLEDAAAPGFARGPALSADATRVEFTAADRGLGLARLELTVDGNATWSETSAEGTCRPPFVAVVPCPLTRAAGAPLDASRLADGDHELRVRATDVAGNVSLSAPLTLRTRGGRPLVAGTPPPPVASPAPGSTLAAWFAGKARALVATTAYRRRGRVEGLLTGAGGAPLAGALLQVDDGGAKGETTTDAKGRFAYRTLGGPSRTITISYANALIARLTLRVRAGVTLATSTTRVRNGTTLRFNGRLLGERTRGALVTIYALGDGSRRRTTVATVRARAKGRFSYAYTFKSLQARTTFRFEARAVKQSGLPYETGASRRVVVHARP